MDPVGMLIFWTVWRVEIQISQTSYFDKKAKLRTSHTYNDI